MPNPQQPELRRSENVPALSPDAMEAELEATDPVDLDSSSSPADESGHARPDEEQPTGPVQDQPDLDEMAEALGTNEAE